MAEIRDFGGLDNQNAPSDFGLKRLVLADNIDITRAGKIKTRKGRMKLSSATIEAACALGDSILYQSGDSLYQVVSGGQVNHIRDGLTVTNTLCAEEVNGKIYWSNNIENGVVSGGEPYNLGIISPENVGFSPDYGMMPSGRYLYAITFTRSDGLESGARLSGIADITTGGIALHTISAPSGVVGINLYLSTVNGEVMYLAGQFLPGLPVAYRDDTRDLVVALENLGCDAPPAFSSACYYLGRMYYMHGNVLWASLPYNLEMIDYAQDFVVLPEAGALCAAVDDGIYVATASKTYFLAGSGPHDFVSREVLGYGATHGTAAKVERAGDRPRGVAWMSPAGVVVGMNSGNAANVTNGVFAPGNAGAGCGSYREQDGQKHYVASLRNERVPYNARKISMISTINNPLQEVFGTG